MVWRHDYEWGWMNCKGERISWKGIEGERLGHLFVRTERKQIWEEVESAGFSINLNNNYSNWGLSSWSTKRVILILTTILEKFFIYINWFSEEVSSLLKVTKCKLWNEGKTTWDWTQSYCSLNCIIWPSKLDQKYERRQRLE